MNLPSESHQSTFTPKRADCATDNRAARDPHNSKAVGLVVLEDFVCKDFAWFNLSQRYEVPLALLPLCWLLIRGNLRAASSRNESAYTGSSEMRHLVVVLVFELTLFFRFEYLILLSPTVITVHDLRIICIKLKLCPIDISSLRLENASLTLFGERVTPAVQRYHVDPDGQADGQSLWLLQPESFLASPRCPVFT